MTETPIHQRLPTHPSRYLAATPDPKAALRLFCFHEGGGTASSFSAWAGAFGPDVSVVPIQLPGHGSRFREAPITDRHLLLRELNENLRDELDTPHAFYGQCMGALLAHCLASVRVSNGQRAPECLLTGGCKPPPAQTWIRTFIDLPDEELADFLINIGTLSPELRDRPQWRAAALALGRNDGALFLDYQPDTPPLPCPIHTFVGEDDSSMSPDDASGWAARTSTICTTAVVPGGHLFNLTPPSEFITQMRLVLNDHIRTSTN